MDLRIAVRAARIVFDNPVSLDKTAFYICLFQADQSQYCGETRGASLDAALAIHERRPDAGLDITRSLDKSNLVDISSGVAGTSSTGLTRSAALFHALSDETRLDILARLRDGEQCVCELTDILKAAQSRLSFHLKVLKDAGLIRDRAEGRWMYYALNEEAFEEVEDLIRTFKKAAKPARSATRCC